MRSLLRSAVSTRFIVRNTLFTKLALRSALFPKNKVALCFVERAFALLVKVIYLYSGDVDVDVFPLQLLFLRR